MAVRGMCLVPTERDFSSHDAMIDLADIAPSFSFVTGKDLVPSAGDYMPDHFGNAVLVMVGSSFSLRFKRDRGQVFVDAGSDAAGWQKLEYVLEFVDGTATQKRLGEPPNLAAMAKVLALNWDKVASLFSDQERSSELQEFAQQKSAAMLGRLFPKL